MRLRAAFTATRIAESFRDQGADVVLMMDSLTRFGHGPARGRPVRRRAAGHPRLPAVGLRPAARACSSGPAPGEAGSITGLYTVLVEGDDMNEPIADAARSILDGHIVARPAGWPPPGHFPSIDVARVGLPGRRRGDHAGPARAAPPSCAGCWPPTATPRS